MAETVGVRIPVGHMAPLTRSEAPIQLPSYDPAGGNSGAGNQNPTGGGQGQSAQPGSGNAGGQRTGQFSYNEDRTDWVPRHRLNDNTAKFEKRIEELTNQITGLRSGVGKAFGFEQADPAVQRREEIKTALLEVFPNLKSLENLSEEKIQELMDAAAGAKQTTQAQWERHATTMLTTLETQVSEQLGIDKLTPTQQKNLRRAYREEARDCLNARNRAAQTGEPYDASNDFLARHERGDQSLLKEFAKAYLDDWFEPARRRVTADTTRRMNRPVPRGERARNQIAGGAAPVDYNNPDAFKKAILDARNTSRE
jgi:hypothetical protein